MVKFDIQVDIPSDVLAEPASRAEHILALQIKKDTTPFVPALTGSLSTRTRVEEGTVIYPGPYARYLYYGKLMVDPETGRRARARSRRTRTWYLIKPCTLWHKAIGLRLLRHKT